MNSLKPFVGLSFLLVASLCLAQDENPVLKLKGHPLPLIDMTTTKGARIKNSTLKGKVTLVDFWASWCGPCHLMSKVMEEVHAKYLPKKVIVIGADLQEQSPLDLKKSLRTHPKKYTVTVKNDSFSDKIGVVGLPTVLIIDKHGIVREVYTGYAPSLNAAIDKNVSDLLAEK